jgi:hypothetical protein
LKPPKSSGSRAATTSSSSTNVVRPGTLGVTLMVGHFAAPFLIMLIRQVKRKYGLLMIVAAWAIVVHILDIYWIVRPMVYITPADAPQGPMVLIADLLGIAGPVLLLVGYLVKRIGSSVLVGVGDPFMHEAMEHRNYV